MPHRDIGLHQITAAGGDAEEDVGELAVVGRVGMQLLGELREAREAGERRSVDALDAGAERVLAIDQLRVGGVEPAPGGDAARCEKGAQRAAEDWRPG
jgi:hypothetical protein